MFSKIKNKKIKGKNPIHSLDDFEFFGQFSFWIFQLITVFLRINKIN